MTRVHWIERALGHTIVVLLAITLLATAGAAAPDASVGNRAPTPPNATASDHLRAATGHGPWSQVAGQPQQYAVATQTSSAGAPNVEWSRSLAGTGYDVRQRSDGGYVVAGTRGDDVWVATFDANGTREWSRTYGGGGEDIAYSLFVTDDGSYLVAGKTESYGPGIAAAWLLKLDAETGDGMWEETYGGDRRDVAFSVIEAADGGYLLTGMTNTTDGGDDDLLAVKVSQSGTREWIETYGGSNTESAGLGALRVDDGYVIAGETGSFGEGNVWLLSIDGSGDKRWSRTYAGARAWDIVRARDDGYVLAGKRARDHLLIKVGTLGGKQWSKTYGRADSLQLSYRVTRAPGNGYVAGGLVVRGSSIFKVTEQGAREWNLSYDEAPIGLNRTADGGYVATNNALTKFGPPTEPPVPRFDYSPAAPVADEPIRFNASRSSDPDGEVTAYAWDFDADGTRDATGRLIGHTFDTAGDHTVRLTVTDDDGATATTTETVTVAPETTRRIVLRNATLTPTVVGDNRTARLTLTVDVANVSADGRTDTLLVQFPSGVERVTPTGPPTVTDATGTRIPAEVTTFANNTARVDVNPDPDAGGSVRTLSVETAFDVAIPDVETDRTARVVVDANDSFTGAARITPTFTIVATTAGPRTNLTLRPHARRVVPGGTASYEVVVDAATGGVGSYDLTVSVAEATTARITATSNAIGGTPETTLAGDGSEARLGAFAGDTVDTGAVVVATVTLRGVTAGTTTVRLTPTTVSDEDGRLYAIGTVTNATVTVTEQAAPDVTGDGNPARDPDEDGVYEDVNGDGTVAPGDATVLFNAVFARESVVTDNVALFDVNGDGSLTPGDATVLFQEAFGG